MRLVIGLGIAGLLWIGLTSPAGEPGAVPARYRDIPKSKLARLVEVWGTPEMEPAMGHTAVFSLDGKLALHASTQGEETSVTLWDVAKGTITKEWRLAKTGVTAVALSPDNKRALIGLIELDKKGVEKIALRVRDLASGKEFELRGDAKDPALMGHTAPIGAVAIAADGRHALSGALDGTVKLWDLDKGGLLRALPGHKQNGSVSCVAFAPDSKTAFSAGQDNAIRVWDLKNGKELREMQHAAGAIGLSVSSDGSRLAAISYDHTVKIWDTAAGKELKMLKREPPSNGFGTLALAPDGKKVLAILNGFDPTGTTEETHVVLWDTMSGKPLWSIKTDLKGFVPIHYEKKLTGGGVNRFSQWDLDNGREAKSWGRHKGAVSGIAVTGNGVVSVGQDGSIQPWRGGGISARKRHMGAINAVAVCPKDKWLITGGGDKTVKAWKGGNKAWDEAFTFTGHTDTVTSVGVDPDGMWAVSGSADRTLKLWDLTTGKELETLAGHARNVNAVAVSPSGNWIASASDDGNIRLWPVQNGKTTGASIVLEGHKREVMSVAFSPDGKRLLSGSQDMTLKVWDVVEATCTKTLEGHKNWVNVVACRNDNQAASASDDLTVRLWDLQTGKEIDQIDLAHSTDVARSLAFDRKTNALLVGTASWVILRFELGK
jgi:WD40 repeat protein